MSTFFLCYNSTQNVLAYAAPGAIFVPGQGVRLDPIFRQAQARGAEVSPYLDVPEYHVRGKLDQEFFDFCGSPLWGNGRKSYYPLTDIRVGSQYVKRAVEYIAEKLMPTFDGVTLDVVGGQLHSRADWKNWPEAERAEWRAGCVDFLRLLDEARRQIKPWFKIVTINIWHETKEGLKYLDGFFYELPPLGFAQFVKNIIAEDCGYLGQRRVMVIARTEAEAKVYATLPGVTHVTAVNSSLGQDYLKPTPPVVKPVDRRLPEALAMRQWLQQNRSGDDILKRENDELRLALHEATGDRTALGARVDLLTAKVQGIGAFVAKEVEGVE